MALGRRGADFLSRRPLAESARIGEPGLTPQSRNLEPMQFAGTVTYGNFFTMTSPGPYRIEVDVRRHGDLKPAQAVFEYRHPRR